MKIRNNQLPPFKRRYLGSLKHINYGKSTTDFNLIEARVWELDENLELTTEDIFDVVCQEYHLNAELIEKELNCKCPFAIKRLFKGVRTDRSF
ncbi:MAG: hypothetical protein ACYTXT_38055 [Nostoc sp.]